MYRRQFLALSALFGAFTALRGVDYALGARYALPKLAFADELVDLLLFLKTKTRLICLGDTDHEKPQLYAFLSDRSSMERLGRGGVENIFLEISIRFQKIFEDLQKGKTKPDSGVASMPKNAWLSGAENEILARKRSEALWRLEKPTFHAIDERSSGSELLSPSAYVLANLGDFFHHLFLPQSTAGHVWQDLSVIAQNRFGGGFGFPFVDDRRPAQKILEAMKGKEGTGLAVYGAGHFDGHAERLGGDSMFKLAKKAGLAPILVNFFFSEQVKEAHYREGLRTLERSFRSASVDFILQKDASSRIAFNDEKLGREFAERPSAAKRPALSGLSRRDFLRFRV